jgi:hypothetical protein
LLRRRGILRARRVREREQRQPRTKYGATPVHSRDCDEGYLDKVPVDEPEQVQLRRLGGETYDSVQVIRVVCALSVGGRWGWRRSRMRMIEPDDSRAELPRAANGGEMVSGVEQIFAPGIVGHVASADDVRHLRRRPEHHPATLQRCFVPRVRDDRVERRPLQQNHNRLRPGTDDQRPQTNDYRRSTAIAIPMPPPMHSEATPYRRLRARSA